MRRVLTMTVAVAAVASGTSVGAAHAVVTAPAVSAPRCTTGSLRISMVSAPGEAGVGNRGAFLRFTNVSRGACTVRGYPGLSLNNAAGRPLKSTVTWGPTYFNPSTVSSLTLPRGASAWANVAWATAYSPLQMVRPAYLTVIPPGARTSQRVPFTQPVGQGRLTVTALSSTRPRS